MTRRRGAEAYQDAAATRSARECEADVFRRATGALRGGGPELDRVRAIADNRRLWNTVVNLMQDPANALPQELRAGIVSLGIAVQREMDSAAPDFGFLIAVNETVTAGLSAAG